MNFQILCFHNGWSLKISFRGSNYSDKILVISCQPVKIAFVIKQLMKWKLVSGVTFSATFVLGTLLFIRVGDWRGKLLCDYKKKWSLRNLFSVKRYRVVDGMNVVTELIPGTIRNYKSSRGAICREDRLKQSRLLGFRISVEACEKSKLLGLT